MYKIIDNRGKGKVIAKNFPTKKEAKDWICKFAFEESINLRIKKSKEVNNNDKN